MTIEDIIADAVVRKLEARGWGPPQTSPRILEVKAAAAYMGRSVSGIRKLIATGEIPGHIVKKFGGRTVLIVAELDKCLEAH